MNQLPHNVELEKSLIASCLIIGPGEIVESVSPEDFYNTKLGELFSKIAELHAKSEPVDISTLVGIASATELSQLMDHPVAISAEHSCQKLKDLSAVRKLVATTSAITQKCMEFRGNDAADLINEAQTSVLSIEAGITGDCFQRIGPSCSETIEHLEKLSTSGSKITGITSGYDGIDKITGGFQKSDLIILAARPGMGKTAFALNLAENAAKEDTPTAFFSLEMARHQLNCRLIARGARMDSKKLRTGRLGSEDWNPITNSVSRIFNIPLYVDDTPSLHYMEIRRRARKLKRERGIGLILIDYLQLARGDNQNFREREVSSISQGFKAMAKELNIPVIALSQLNRKLDDLSEKRPSLSHLRESGSLEQDSDIVMFIHRDDYYNRKDDNPRKGIAEIIFAKHRNGPTGWCPLTWIPEQSAFENFYGEYDPK